MKNSILIYGVILIFLTIGCSTSKDSIANKKQGSEDQIVHYHISTKTTEGEENEPLIEKYFSELENLELPLVKVHYNQKEAIKYDCEVEVLFDKLFIKDKEYSKNKHFSKVIQDQQTQAEEDDGPLIYSETVRRYVYQDIKERKLNWDIIMEIKSDSNHCKLTNNSFTETFISKSINNTLSGDERAISKKYKEPIAQPLLSKSEIKERAIMSVYKNLVYELKKNH